MRLMIYFSYIGTNYRGLQRTLRRNTLPGFTSAPDLDSIQGILEFGLQKVFRRDSRVPVYVSSRTDTGVHALSSTCVFDIPSDIQNAEWTPTNYPNCPETICQSLNLFLDKNECDIRVQRVIQVPPNFNARRALSRVYEFRVAIFNQVPHNIFTPNRLTSAVSILDLFRCEAIPHPFDLPVVQQSCNLFLGTWDFTTFMKSGGEDVPPEKRIKTIRRFSLSPESIPISSPFDPLDLTVPPPYKIYKFTVEGSGFLRRQVRRMVGCLVAVGRGLINPSDITWMLKNPSEQNWHKKAVPLGPHGLFLKQVNYNPQDFQVLRGYLS